MLTATDKAGNSATAQGSVTIDAIGPHLTLQIYSSNDIFVGNIIGNVRPTFSGQMDPGIRITVSIAGGTYDVIADEGGDWSRTVPVSPRMTLGITRISPRMLPVLPV
ncbi:hypothetical protein PL78_16235 [Yersinia entomophaga]|uniref:Bacterial Ig-like domain-containing protein n=1 Tax=Yersinia entomophaga TaxID=935293 RepID=A0ABM6BP52_YERET|nr:hypothetical protein [Yersinia entomophaga]ANI31360.1 hypothetical protein PL78_16235 [Yersinia entomophaga]